MPDNDDLRRMDVAAEEAQKELMANLDHWSARALASWWAKWYLKAGHKRLGRLLVDLAK
jgi:hypothetical protein